MTATFSSYVVRQANETILSELKIQRELYLPCPGSRNGSSKSGYGRQAGAKDWIDLRNVRAVEQVEELSYDIKALCPAEWEVFQDTQIRREQCGRL
jgi:hypothetical protein